MKVIAIIPARYKSRRFSGKLLTPILNKSLLRMTYENVCSSALFSLVIILTDDERIQDEASSFGATTYISKEPCVNGTDRIIQALQNNRSLIDSDIIVNVQADHPCLSKETINSVINLLINDPTAVMATAVMPTKDKEIIFSKNCVKCVFDRNYNALYFSRSAIPYQKDENYFSHLHLGIYAYRTKFLLDLAPWENCHLQQMEDLEQLAIMEKGFPIKVCIVKDKPIGVDTPEDIAKVEEYLCQ